MNNRANTTLTSGKDLFSAPDFSKMRKDIGKATMQMVTCRKCKVVKPASEFHKSTRNATGVQSYCKVCNNQKRDNRPSHKYRNPAPQPDVSGWRRHLEDKMLDSLSVVIREAVDSYKGPMPTMEDQRQMAALRLQVAELESLNLTLKDRVEKAESQLRKMRDFLGGMGE